MSSSDRPPTPSSEIAAGQRLRLSDKIAFSSGVVASQTSNGIFNQLLVPIYQITLGINPMLIGLVQTIMRLWDAVTDPLMANWSDNARTRWGRRRPFIFAGGILIAFIYPLIWFPSATWSEGALFTYLLITSLAYLTAHTLYTIPYESLGLELTDDYNERTRLYAFRAYIPQIIGLGAGWIYALIQADFFGGTLNGMRFVGIALGGLILATALWPALRLREKNPVKAHRAPPPFFRNLGGVFSNRPFVLMASILVFGSLASSVFSQMNIYAKIYVLYGGNTKAGAFLNAWVSLVYSSVYLASIPLGSYLAQRFSKKAVLAGSACVGFLSGFAKLVCYDPTNPYLTLVIPLFAAPVAAVNGFVVSAMMADVAFYDRWKTGERREGMITATASWLYKMSFSVSGVLGGTMLVLVGFDVKLGGAQTDFTKSWLVYGMVLGSAVPAAVTLTALAFYKLSPEVMEKCRREVTARDEAAGGCG